MDDVMTLLFYKTDVVTEELRPCKTKIIGIGIFIGVFIIYLFYNLSQYYFSIPAAIFSALWMGVVIALPASIVGYMIGYFIDKSKSNEENYTEVYKEDIRILKQRIASADANELEYIRNTNQKKYWWSSLFITGLFYGINGKVGRMLLSWLFGLFTLGLFSLFTLYTSYKDEKSFNNEMELAIFKRKQELSGSAGNAAPQIQQVKKPEPASEPADDKLKCSSCGGAVLEESKFCPHCGFDLQAEEESSETSEEPTLAVVENPVTEDDESGDSEKEAILAELAKQKSDDELYNQIGIVFSIDDLDGGVYGNKAYSIIYDNLDPAKMGTFRLYDGDTKATLDGSGDYDYCIAIQSDDPEVIKYARETMAFANDKGLSPLSKRFIYAYDLENEPLVYAAEVVDGKVHIQAGGPPVGGLSGFEDKWEKVM